MLLAASPAHVRSMTIAALDTGMRRGEMMALRFADVDWGRGLIVLRGETTKSRKTRLVPISTQRLRAVFEWRTLRAQSDASRKRDLSLISGTSRSERLLFQGGTRLTPRSTMGDGKGVAARSGVVPVHRASGLLAVPT
jgi:integrase